MKMNHLFCWMVLFLTVPMASLMGEPFEGKPVKEGAAYRANLQRSGVFNATGIKELKGLKWKADIGGEIHSSPVVFKDTLYIGAGDGFYALDTKDGSVRWKYPVHGGVDSSACVADGVVCFTTLQAQLIALNTSDGTPRWIYTGRSNGSGRGSPAIAYGVVFSPVGREIVALSLDTGAVIWKIDQNVPDQYSSLALAPDVFYGTGVLAWGYLYAYDYTTTEIQWKSRGPYEAGAGVYFFKSPAIGEDGSIYVNTTRGVRKFPKTPAKSDYVAEGNSAPDWYAFLLEKQVDDNEMIQHSCPTPWKDRVYAGRGDGKFVALNTKDGAIAWMRKMPDAIVSDPSIAAPSGLVYFGCYDGNLYALDTETGETRWSFKTGGRIFSSPWVGDGFICVASQDGVVYTLE